MADGSRVVKFKVHTDPPVIKDRPLNYDEVMAALEGRSAAQEAQKAAAETDLSKVVFPDIRDTYLQDPLAATLGGIAPYHHQASISDAAKAELARALEFRNTVEEQREQMHEEPMFALFEMVRGAVLDRAELNLEMDMVGGEGGIQLATSVDPAPTEGGNVPVAQGEQVMVRNARGDLEPADPTAARELAIQRRLRRAATQPHVSGVQHFPPAFTAAVRAAIVDVKRSNFTKFSEIKIESFFGNDEAMTLLSELVAAIYISRRIREPGKYYKDHDAARRNAERDAALDSINSMFVLDRYTNKLIQASVKEYRRAELHQTVGRLISKAHAGRSGRRRG